MAGTHGIVVVAAGGMAAAVQRVERWGCLVESAKAEGDGLYALDVRLTAASANELAYAVARKDVVFSRHPDAPELM